MSGLGRHELELVATQILALRCGLRTDTFENLVCVKV